MTTHSGSLASSERKWLQLFIGLGVLVNCSGLFVTIMVPDAAVYATLSKHMVVHHDYWQLILEGRDWLDKPHFPFWITAFFFEIFGIHTWSYKLPAILFVMMGAWYTYKFAKAHFGERIALWAALIFLTAEHIILSNNDVRAEPFLTGLVMAGIYYFYRAITTRTFVPLLLGSLFTACAVMTKGIFALIPIGGAVVGELILKKDWKQLFHIRWLIAAVLILLFITPELYSLWYQFDRHPEKVVFGEQQVSGIRFFFWDSQFGRFFNTGPIKGKGDKFFFLHTLLWAFLPWSLLMYAGLFKKIRTAFRKKGVMEHQEWFTLSGAVLTLLLFSLSGFQLPHYTNIIFPLLAIMTAEFIVAATAKAEKFIRISQYTITIVALLLCGVIGLLYQPAVNIILFVILLAVVALLILLQFRLSTQKTLRALLSSALAVVIVNLFMNWLFYPDLMTYQSSSTASFYINKTYEHPTVISLDDVPNAMEFYLDGTYINRDTTELEGFTPPARALWFVSDKQLAYLEAHHYGAYTVLKEWDHFSVTRLTLKFVNRKTRYKDLSKYYLVQFGGSK